MHHVSYTAALKVSLLANLWRRANGIILVIVAALSIHFYVSNRKADKGEKVIEDLPSFRYTI